MSHIAHCTLYFLTQSKCLLLGKFVIKSRNANSALLESTKLPFVRRRAPSLVSVLLAMRFLQNVFLTKIPVTFMQIVSHFSLVSVAFSFFCFSVSSLL